jgi:5-oxoprolinase (ATP-hydrolysing) subunit C
MPALVIVDAGSSSIQGLGRYGAQRYGIAPGGAMDRFALAESNALTGQPAGAAAIEIGTSPARFMVSGGPIRIALSGAMRDVFVDDRPVSLGMSHLVTEGELISIRGARQGHYTYLSIQGGLHGREETPTAPERSQHDAGGKNSWIFRKDDRVSVKTAISGQSEQQLRIQRRTSAPIRVVLGPQLDYFSEQALNGFLTTPWVISHASNRMAYALEGGCVELHKGFDIVSDGTVTGNIQIPGSGHPIVILRDRGTIGGYPKIATIISADIGRFVQTPIAEKVRFEPVSVVEAQALARDFAFEISNLKPKLESIRRPNAASAATLFTSNVAGDAFNASDWNVDGSFYG